MQTAILRCLSHIAKNEKNGIKEFKSGQRHQFMLLKRRRIGVWGVCFLSEDAIGLCLVFMNGMAMTAFI